jgi:hypothetical protein
MKRVIRNRYGLYLVAEGTWTKFSKEVQCFPDIQSALLVKERYGLKYADIVLLLDDKPSTRREVVLSHLDPAA